MKIVFFGDSICFGQFVSPSKVWVTRLCEVVSNKYDNVVISNPSISGNTTRMALARMSYDVQAHGVDLMYIQYGINDCNYWETDHGVPRVSERSFEANLVEIINRARVSGAKKIVMNTNHPTDKELVIDGVKREHQEGNCRYNAIIRNVAKEDGSVVLIDMEKSFFDAIENGVKLSELLLDDGIHLSLDGHDLYFSKICPVIEKEVAELA